ncbi:hypothetical protein GWI33_017521 [Rhynchophorus ferrugineus]|uniref:Uncharacterized protein n=1 Tax=Rhynchophorus ferrugineus TaxID=354439 RepID=A0A834M2D4_RHYFE|nr:hypothetical protein GWI33_017521 [Rhynchophorus ferrugineus]
MRVSRTKNAGLSEPHQLRRRQQQPASYIYLEMVQRDPVQRWVPFSVCRSIGGLIGNDLWVRSARLGAGKGGGGDTKHRISLTHPRGYRRFT